MFPKMNVEFLIQLNNYQTVNEELEPWFKWQN